MRFLKYLALAIAVLTISMMMPSLGISITQYANCKISGHIVPMEQTVYITNTGKKYHKGTCRHVAKSKIAIKKSEAIKKGYSACSVCKP